MKRALITGITGQDGSYLAELLLSKGYEVHGLVRDPSQHQPDRLPFAHVSGSSDMAVQRRIEAVRDAAAGRADALRLHQGDLNDSPDALAALIAAIRPDEVYNLGALTHVHLSWQMPEYTTSTNTGGTIRLLEAIREAGLDTRFFQASTSEMFGLDTVPQHEESPFRPRSPYGTSKVASHLFTVNYREAYGMFAVSGILFNHESPRRGEGFLTRKVTKAIARIKAGLQDDLALGRLDSVRDWGYAPEYVEGMWLMLQQDEPEDFVFATGTGTTVQEFIETAFDHAGLHWRDYVTHDERFERPAEVHALIGDASKAHRMLGWKAQTHADDLARIMVDADLALLGRS